MSISVNVDGSEEELEQIVDDDIAQFEKYFRSLGNEGLNRFERCILKTYLHYKTHEETCPDS